MKGKFNKPTVLVAPLDWGLGHATRCIVLIKSLKSCGYKVIIGSSGPQKTLLQNEFPEIDILDLKGYQVTYARIKWLLPVKLLFQLPRIYKTIRYEYRWLDSIIDQYEIDLVISDNRFGLHSTKVPCIFITHQLVIKTPFSWLEFLLQKVNYSQINQFNRCWVPDAEGEVNLAGKLSHPKNFPSIPVYYMGLLSRFDGDSKKSVKQYDFCIVLSGPEPQRTILEEKIINEPFLADKKVLLVRGKPNKDHPLKIKTNVVVKNHLSGAELQEVFLKSEYIISRTGYTTVMELLSLQIKSILIPTPGQTEQEYLAKRLLKFGWGLTIKQKDFNMTTAIKTAEKFCYQTTNFPVFNTSRLRELLLFFNHT